MIVYVETNFVLELAFFQEEHGYCTQLLDLAEANDIKLVIPAYSLAEPYEKLIRRRRERKQLSERLRTEINELGRSAPYANYAEHYADLARLLIDANEQENQRLNDSLRRIIDFATIIPTERTVLHEALDVQHDLGLSPQDSIVYASVRQHLIAQKDARCFINKNTRDFQEPVVAAEFERHQCLLLPAFSHGVRYIEARRQDVASNSQIDTSGDGADFNDAP